MSHRFSARAFAAAIASLLAFAVSAAEPTTATTQAAAPPAVVVAQVAVPPESSAPAVAAPNAAAAMLPVPSLGAANPVVSNAATPATASTLDDQARFLAGLPVSAGSPLAAWQSTSDYLDHVKVMNSRWKTLSDRLDKATAWQQSELAPRIKGDRNLIYFFGGPDAVHAIRLFPAAPLYLLAGLEPVGMVEPPEKMKFNDVHTAIDGLSYGLRTFVDKSFFRTTEMGKDLQGRGIKGVLPVLYLMLSRSGAIIDGTVFFELDAKGLPAEKAANEKWGPGVPGVRVKFHFEGKPPQEMLYLRANVINDGMAKQPGLQTWVRTLGPANGLLKSASFILHDNAFSTIRSVLLETCAAFVEDDSGVPLRAFQKGGWDFTCFGKYLAPRDPFERQYQADLDKLCKEQPSRVLPFMIGYRKLNDTFLLLASRKEAAAIAAAPEATPAPAAPAAATNAVAPVASPVVAPAPVPAGPTPAPEAAVPVAPAAPTK